MPTVHTNLTVGLRAVIRRIETEKIDPRKVVTDTRFQPRTETGVTAIEVDRMRAEGKRRGRADGWDPALYDPIKVWAPQGGLNLYVFEGFHRTALAVACGQQFIESRVHYGYEEDEITALARRSNTKFRPQEPLEEAAIFAADRESGMTWNEISTAYDRRIPSYYERRASLAYLDPQIKAAVRSKQLRVEYAEVIGALAQKGASVTLQLYLRDLAWTGKMRVEVFRALGAALARPTSNGSVLPLFNLKMDDAVQAAQEAAGKAAALLVCRDAWGGVARAGQTLLRLLRRQKGDPEAEGIDEVVDAIAVARTAVMVLNGELGDTGGGDEGDNGSTVGAVAAAILEREGEVATAARPLMKWVGGKTWLLPTLAPRIRVMLEARGDRARLIEPFAGGAALTLSVGPPRGILSDIEHDPTLVYWACRSDPDRLHDLVEAYRARGEGKEEYFIIRAEEPEDPFERAARLIYLVRLGWHGLYRTNRKGKFNVPYGDSGGKAEWPTTADYAAAARALAGVEVVCSDAIDLISAAGSTDVIYADPPFEGAFDGYSGGHGPVDHDRLATELHVAVERGASVIVSQPGGDATRRRYGGWCEVIDLSRAYRVGGKADRRGRRGEALCVAKEGSL